MGASWQNYFVGPLGDPVCQRKNRRPGTRPLEQRAPTALDSKYPHAYLLDTLFLRSSRSHDMCSRGGSPGRLPTRHENVHFRECGEEGRLLMWRIRIGVCDAGGSGEGDGGRDSLLTWALPKRCSPHAPESYPGEPGENRSGAIVAPSVALGVELRSEFNQSCPLCFVVVCCWARCSISVNLGQPLPNIIQYSSVRGKIVRHGKPLAHTG